MDTHNLSVALTGGLVPQQCSSCRSIGPSRHTLLDGDNSMCTSPGPSLSIDTHATHIHARMHARKHTHTSMWHILVSMLFRYWYTWELNMAGCACTMHTRSRSATGTSVMQVKACTMLGCEMALQVVHKMSAMQAEACCNVGGEMASQGETKH
eukprot:1160791-Pelagomonas_calceolata.AAC.11